MKKYSLFLIIVFLFATASVQAASFSIPFISQATTTDTNDTTKNNDINNLIKILQNPSQREALIKSLQEANSKEVVVKEVKSDETNEINIFNLKIFVLDYLEKIDITGLYHEVLGEISYTKDYSLKTWRYWLLLLGVSLLFFVASQWLLAVFIKFPKGTIKKKEQYTIFSYKDTIYNAKLILQQIFSIILPLSLGLILALVIVRLFDSVAFTYQIYYLLFIFAILNAAYQTLVKIVLPRDQDLNSAIIQSIKYLLFSFYIFIVINNILVQNYIQAQYTTLLRLNLFIFMLIFTFQLIKIRQVFLLNQEMKGTLLISFLRKKRYYLSTILIVTIFCSFITITTDYVVAKNITTQVITTIFTILAVYLTQRLVIYYFLKKIKMSLDSNIHTLIKNNIDFKSAYQYLSLKKLWTLLVFLLEITTIVVLLFIVDKIWNSKIMIDFLVSKKLYASIIVNIYIFLVAFISLSLFIVLRTQNKINKLTKNAQHNEIRKSLSLYILLHPLYYLFIIFLLAIVILASMNVSVTTLLASTGIITFLVGFGAKDILKNFFNSIMFIIEDNFTLNDFIEVSGKSGTVESMSLSYLKLRDSEGKLHMIPFSTVDVVTNYTKDYAYALMDIVLSYNTNIEDITKISKDIYTEISQDKEYNKIILGPLEISGVTTLGESNITFRCKIKTIAGQQWKVKYMFLQLLQERFVNLGITSPYHEVIKKVINIK